MHTHQTWHPLGVRGKAPWDQGCHTLKVRNKGDWNNRG